MSLMERGPLLLVELEATSLCRSTERRCVWYDIQVRALHVVSSYRLRDSLFSTLPHNLPPQASQLD